MKRLLALLSTVAVTVAGCSTVAADDGSLKLPSYKKLKLENGLTVMLMEQHEVPVVSFTVLVGAGSVADPAGKEGLASLTAGLLRKGTKTRSADQVSADLDFIGGLLGARAGFDYTTISAEFIKKDIGKGLELLADTLLNATFPEDEVAKLMKQRIDGLKAAKDRAQGVIGSYYESYLYGGHPYGRPPGGSEKSLATASRADIVKFYDDHYRPGVAVLAVAGDFSTPEMERMLTARFGAWKGKALPPAGVVEKKAVQGRRLLLVDKPDSTQTFYTIGNVGISRTNPDRVFIDVVNTLFGGRFTSMLNTELRIKTGLTYGARSSFSERKAAGPFAISTYTRNETTEKAIDMTLEVLKRLHEKGISDEELKSAKNYLKGQFPPDIETTDQLAALLAELEFYGLDEREISGYYSKIDSMTVADARRIIKQYFPLDDLVFVLIGKADEIRGVAKKYAAKVDSKSITDPGF